MIKFQKQFNFSAKTCMNWVANETSSHGWLTAHSPDHQVLPVNLERQRKLKYMESAPKWTGLDFLFISFLDLLDLLNAEVLEDALFHPGLDRFGNMLTRFDKGSHERLGLYSSNAKTRVLSATSRNNVCRFCKFSAMACKQQWVDRLSAKGCKNSWAKEPAGEESGAHSIAPQAPWLWNFFRATSMSIGIHRG